MANLYKVTGETHKGKCACGHTAKKKEEYYIIRLGKHLNSLCKNCSSGTNAKIVDVSHVADIR